MSSSPVERVVRAIPGAIGLAVIITNEDYTSSPPALGLVSLPGAARDGQVLSQALTGLNFAVHHVRNTSHHALRQVVYEISRLKYHMVRDYRCIMFVYAGHGCEGDLLYMPEGARVHLGEEIITPLLPGSANDIGGIPKVFLIDACRGSKDTDTVFVPRGIRLNNRGGSLMERVKVTAMGEYLLAYSTMPRHKAFEVERQGGVWLSTLARLLNERRYLNSLENLLTKVNEEIQKRLQGTGNFQQPEKYSRINKIISLDPNGVGRGADCRQQITSGGATCGGQVAPRNAAAPEVSQYRVALHEYCQKLGENAPEYKCDEDRDGSMKSIFKCTVTCVIGGRKISKDSGGFHSRKDTAKEMAAKKLFLALSGSGSPGAAARPKVVQQKTQSRSSTDVSWVSKLKEHYDRLGKSEAVLDSKYKLKITADGGFVYRIYVPELGREVEGEVAKSKKEAKQNAAKKALLSLPKRT